MTSNENENENAGNSSRNLIESENEEISVENTNRIEVTDSNTEQDVSHVPPAVNKYIADIDNATADDGDDEWVSEKRKVNEISVVHLRRARKIRRLSGQFG